MNKLISISTDRNVFTDGSPVQLRQKEYCAQFDEVHIVVFTTRASHKPRSVQIAPNVWLYGTHSFSKFFHVWRAQSIIRNIVKDRKCTSENSIVTVQDPFETGLVGLYVKKKFGLPLHVQIHTDFQSPYFLRESFFNRLRVLIARNVLPKADAVRVVSKRILESIDPSVLQQRVVPVVLPIFVDFEKIEAAPPTVDLKKKYPQFTFTILIASRFATEKNIPFAVELFKKVLLQYPKTGLILVGSGPQEAHLRGLVRKYGMENNVVFEGWQQDVWSYFKTAHLFLSTSNYEGYGLSIIEALICRCPVISTDVGIADEVLKDGISFVCPIGDFDCMFRKILILIEGASARERFIYEAYGLLDTVTIRSKADYLRLYGNNVNSAQHI